MYVAFINLEKANNESIMPDSIVEYKKERSDSKVEEPG